MIRYILWLDDRRNPFTNKKWIELLNLNKDFEYKVIWVKTHIQFLNEFKNIIPYIVCFDYDLGLTDKSGKKGSDSCQWMLRYCKNNNIKIPKVFIQSANKDGKEKIKNLLKTYKVLN